MTQKTVQSDIVRQHFDMIATSYDETKEKNRFYYQSLITLVSQIVPPGKKVLDIGTGTGEILNALSPSKGTGIDLSPEMVARAKKKFPHLDFAAASYETFVTSESFDYVLLVDVIEHLESPEGLFSALKKFCSPDTEIILTMANPLWEPILYILEKLKLKMEEGPHLRISEKELFGYAEEQGFTIKSSYTSVLFPMKLPLLTPFFNDWVIQIPFLRKLGLIERYVFKRKNGA